MVVEKQSMARIQGLTLKYSKLIYSDADCVQF